MPTPQAGILDQSTRKSLGIPSKQERSDFLDQARLRPQQSTKYEGLIIKTLLEPQKEGKAENTRTNIEEILKQLSRKTDLENPETVKLYISTATNEKTRRPLANATKNKLCLAFDWLCKANHFTWQKPFYKVAERTPIIPTTENVTKIISASNQEHATIFTILAETGADGEELHRTSRSKIDTEQRTITITGTKGHGSATYKLKQKTNEMLREYLPKTPKTIHFQTQNNRRSMAKNKKQSSRQAQTTRA